MSITSWVKRHKVASGAIGCGGLLVLGFVGIVVFGLILMANGYEPEPAETVAEETREPTQEPVEDTPEEPVETPEAVETPEPEPTREPEPEAEEPVDDLAERTHEAVKDAFAVDDLSDVCSDVGYDSWSCLASEWTSPTSGTVVVKVQENKENLAPDFGKQSSRAILNLVGNEIPDLDMVQIVDAGGTGMGITTRSEAPLVD